MADEENKNTEEETVDEAAPEQPEAEEKAEEAPAAEEPKAEEPEAQEASDDSAEEPAEDEEAAEPEADEAPAAAAPGGSGDDDELSWKGKRRLERSRQPHEARPQRSPEERTAARLEKRKASGVERRRYRLGKRAKRDQTGTGTAPAERSSVDRKVRRGTVISNKADKTITVRIDVARRHPTYEKIVRRSSTLHAHDERNEASEGDLVQIVETRPLSKSKRWRLTEIVEKAK